MADGFKNKVAIVTGGGRGIGAAVVEKLALSGAKVVVADVSGDGPSFVERLRESGADASFVRTDVSRQEDTRNMALHAEREYGGIDILVNCAGIFPRATLFDTTEELWDRVLGVNLKGMFFACQAAADAMVRRGSGAIVNIGSNHAPVRSPDLVAYAVSKGGVVTLTRNLARSLAEYRIRVNCVHPGWVASEGEIELRRNTGRPDTWLEEQGARMPLGRLQTGRDLANMVVFLASDEASQVSGQVISVDGGSSAR